MTQLQPLHSHLIHEVFARAVRGDPGLVKAVTDFAGEVRFINGDLVFSLPQLFQFLLIDLERSGHGRIEPSDTEYQGFHRMLYQSQINTELRRLGAIVVVDHADDDHALSLYRLTRLPG
jgi:hypothetical protein